jgi:hypothetical protein
MAKLAKKGKKIKVIDSDEEEGDDFKRDSAAPGQTQEGSEDGGTSARKKNKRDAGSIERQ